MIYRVIFKKTLLSICASGEVLISGERFTKTQAWKATDSVFVNAVSERDATGWDPW